MIQIEHVSKTFSGKYGTVHALDDVSIHVEKGDICGIIGFPEPEVHTDPPGKRS